MSSALACRTQRYATERAMCLPRARALMALFPARAILGVVVGLIFRHQRYTLGLSLAERMKSVGRKAVVAGSVGLASLAYNGNARADTYDINTGWTTAQINQFFDPTPGTDSHPYGTAVPGGGDTVNIATGAYHAVVGDWFKIKTGGTSPSDVLTIQGAGWGTDGTRFVGSEASGEPVMEILGDYIEMDGFKQYDTSPWAGLIVNSSDYNYIKLSNIYSIGFASL